MKLYKCIIIGGGISGLACGNKLHKSGENFLLLSRELGGRMLTSKSRTIDYGASYITNEYKNVLKFVDKGDRLPTRKCYFINGKGFTTVVCWRTLCQLPRLIWLYFVVLDFCWRVRKFRKRCLSMAQKNALKLDPVLNKYVKMPATSFVEKNKLHFFDEKFIEPVLHSTVFARTSEVNAFYYLAILMPFVSRAYTADFRHAVHRLTAGWKNKIKITSVHGLKKLKNSLYKVVTSHGEYLAKNIVLALPQKNARKIYPVPSSGPTIPIYVFHVVGEREEIYRKKKIIFFKPKEHDITILWK